MPTSLDIYTKDIIEHIKAINPTSVLDVGPGMGKYRSIINSINPNIVCDAVEAEIEYIGQFDLKSKYRKVFNQDIIDFAKTNNTDKYDLCIMGDILEHLFLSEAIDIIDALAYRCKFLIIVWPTNLSQDVEWSSVYQLHKSNFKLSDLTRFNIQIYKKTFIFYIDDVPIDMHYAVIAGHKVTDYNSLRKVAQNNQGDLIGIISDV